MMSREDTDENLDGGDLGLGQGLKPGGIPFRPDMEGDVDVKMNPGGCFGPDWSSVKTRSETSHPKRERKQLLDRFTVPVTKLSFLRRSKSDDIMTPEYSEHFSQFADIPLGTSIRQQKKLFERERRGLFSQTQDNSYTFSFTRPKPENMPSDGKDNDESNPAVVKKLRQAEREIEYLRLELEKSQKQVEARHKAMRLLKGQSYAIQTQQLDTSKKAKKLNRTLQQEINQLQFELEYRETTMMTSQEMWAERFNRVCNENTALVASLEERSEGVRKLQAEKAAVVRERDELLALLDVQERQRYDMTKSQSSEESDYNSFSSTELAVLGACRCRIHNPQPCGCAHAAAYMKKEIGRLKELLTKERQQHDEAVIMADAYRIAFEEQLNRCSSLMHRLVELAAESESTNQPKTRSKPSAALKWLIKQLNEEDEWTIKNIPTNNPQSTTPESRSPHPGGPQSSSPELDHPGTDVAPNPAISDHPTPPPSVENGDSDTPSDGTQMNVSGEELESNSDVIQMLLEMIKDRSEALAHQRLAARMLANRIKELENKTTITADEVFDK